MDETILVKSGEGRRVLTPLGQNVPTGTFKVNKNDPYWGRALRVGDLVAVTSTPTPKPDTKKPVNTASNKEDK